MTDEIFPWEENPTPSEEREIELQSKITRAIKFIRSIPNSEADPVEICYSGGKDSDVILQLAKEAGIHYRAIYKSTTIDPPGTIAHVKAMGVEIMKPTISFRELITQYGLPKGDRRFCCRVLKEYKILNKQIQGIRRCESTKRKNRYKEPTQCRIYVDGGREEQFLPILYWSDEDVRDFILDRDIKCAPVYYRNGQLDVEQRLGCLCCPLKGKKKRLNQFREYPKMVVFYLHALQIFRDTHPESVSCKNFKSAYEQFVRDVFYSKSINWEVHKSGILAVQNFDYKAFLEEYFKIKL